MLSGAEKTQIKSVQKTIANGNYAQSDQINLYLMIVTRVSLVEKGGLLESFLLSGLGFESCDSWGLKGYEVR